MFAGSGPEGFQHVTPYLSLDGAKKFIEFVKCAFDAKELRIVMDGERVVHAQVKIGDSILMVSDARNTSEAMPTGLYLYVDDTDAAYRRAMECGGASMLEPADMFYGDRNAGVKDPVGNIWWIATPLTDEAANSAAAK